MSAAREAPREPRQRRPKGEDAVYFDAARNRYAGVISLGYGPGGKRIRRTVRGRTKAEVRQKLRKLHAELDIGVTPAPASYTVRAAVDDWLSQGLGGRSDRTVELYRDGVRPLVDLIGGRQLGKLTAADVRTALAELRGKVRPSPRAVRRVL